jgi:hypothetical protein
LIVASDYQSANGTARASPHGAKKYKNFQIQNGVRSDARSQKFSTCIPRRNLSRAPARSTRAGRSTSSSHHRCALPNSRSYDCPPAPVRTAARAYRASSPARYLSLSLSVIAVVVGWVSACWQQRLGAMKTPAKQRSVIAISLSAPEARALAWRARGKPSGGRWLGLCCAGGGAEDNTRLGRRQSEGTHQIIPSSKTNSCDRSHIGVTKSWAMKP